MKRILTLLMAFCLSVALLAGCGSSQPTSPSSGGTTQKETAATSPSSAKKTMVIGDVEVGFDGGIVAGTGPYIAVDCKSGDHLTLVKNEKYWNGMPHIDELTIRTIADGNTLSAALQAGDIDAAYGMAYEAYPLFRNDNYKFSQIATSRAFFCWMNYDSPLTSDPAVRKAIAMGIDKASFVATLLDGNGEVAVGVFPDSFAFGGSKVKTEGYDPSGAKAVLEAAGWVDTDGDGIREKDGKPLKIKWLTYPSRQELPLLAESAQATLKEIGIAIDINSTADHNSVIKDITAWDVYGSANMNAPIGDPEHFFRSFCLDTSSKNKGHITPPTSIRLPWSLTSTSDSDGKKVRPLRCFGMDALLLSPAPFV